jgi:hypothetical protein
VVTPNNDTPYSWAWLDLRSGPFIVSVPRVDKDRYYVMQWFDLFTHNFAYIGVRTTGRKAGKYMFAPPGWDGDAPEGVKEVFRPETHIIGTATRTSYAGPDDLDAMKRVQEHYRLMPLSEFLGEPAPPEAPAPSFPKWDEEKALSAHFITYLNFLLQFVDVHPSEQNVLRRFESIGIGPGKPFDPDALDTAMLAAIEEGVMQGLDRIKGMTAAATSSAGYFGTREFLENDYLKRAAGAMIGIYGLSMEEAMYTATERDADGNALTGSSEYVLRFGPDSLPPAEVFWSATMYRLPERLLVENPIGRYAIGDRTEDLVYGEDGSLEIYIQNKAPMKKKRANWLPAPSGPFFVVMRMYGPGPEALSGEWKQPLPKKVEWIVR